MDWFHRYEIRLRCTDILRAGRWQVRSFFVLLLATLSMVFSSCGGGSSSSSVAAGTPLIAGNWQIAMTATAGTLFASSPLQGGFLLQNNGSLTGQIAFSIFLPPVNGGSSTLCNSGTAKVTGTISGQTVSFTAVVATLNSSGDPATQTFALAGGKLNSSNTAIQGGTYSLTAGNYLNSSGVLEPCGTAADAGTWAANSVPTISGAIQGFFHSTVSGSAIYNSQDFPVSGTLLQGPNVGTSSATITGTLNFQDPITLLNDYPCLTTASINGTISGDTVLLQIFATTGTVSGQIGHTPGSNDGLSPVVVDSTPSGILLHNVPAPSGAGYQVSTKPCPASGSNPGDTGNVCLALGESTACNQPVTLTPFYLNFQPQLLGSTATAQTITLINNFSTELTGLTLQLQENDSGLFYPTGGDFNGVPHFTEQDNCTEQGTVSLKPGGSCKITVSFSPQESCPWLPQAQSGLPAIAGVAPIQCPINLSAKLKVTLPSGSIDEDETFTVPITGMGMSLVTPSIAELDFGAQAVGEASPPQTITFTNQSPNRVDILPSSLPCPYNTRGIFWPRPPLDQTSEALLDGIEVANTGSGIGFGPILPDLTLLPNLGVDAPTVQYGCDIDPPTMGGSGLPNVQISSDGCSGKTLEPFGQAGDTCTLQVLYAPQPATFKQTAGAGVDDFIQLNTDWCGDANNQPEPNCEIDSGRFPVEIKSNPASPLRMFPGAALDFPLTTKGTAATPMTVTIFNDPIDPNAGTVTFVSKIISGAAFSETTLDTCGTSLATNASCTFTITFIPTAVGLNSGSISIIYTTPKQSGPPAQTIYLRGMGQ